MMAFEQENEREPSVEELAGILEMSENDIASIIVTNVRHTSLDAPMHESEDLSMGDLLTGANDTDETVIQDSLREEIRRILKSLSPRESEIVTAYFGLEGNEGPTIEQIGEKYDLTKERIRQIKSVLLSVFKKQDIVNH
jgi:RNA polymerase primary sigma factor